MTIHNINITTPNTTHLYPVKASIGEPTYNITDETNNSSLARIKSSLIIGKFNIANGDL